MTETMMATRIPMEVSFQGETYRPVMTVWDNGIWRLENHEAMKAAMATFDERMNSRGIKDEDIGRPFESYSSWLIGFWGTKLGSLLFALGNNLSGRPERDKELLEEIRALTGNEERYYH